MSYLLTKCTVWLSALATATRAKADKAKEIKDLNMLEMRTVLSQQLLGRWLLYHEWALYHKGNMTNYGVYAVLPERAGLGP